MNNRLVDAGIEIDLRKMLRLVSESSSLQAEAEAEYAAFLGVIKTIHHSQLAGLSLRLNKPLITKTIGASRFSRHLMQNFCTA